jgi:hypothetical protein
MAVSPTFLTRRQAAALLDEPESAIKARDNVSLHPVMRSDGSWLYPPAEISAILRGVIGGPANVETTGAVCAAAFEQFRKGTSLPDVVIELRQPPAVVRSLRGEFDNLASSLTVAPDLLAALSRILDTSVKSDAILLELVDNLAERARHEYERGYHDGLEAASDLGEIVDHETGERRRLDPSEAAANARVAEAKWAASSAQTTPKTRV